MVPPSSHRVSRVRRYSGYSWLSCPFVYGAITRYGVPSHVLQLELNIPFAVRTPKVLLPSVWPLPRSLATTNGISVDVFSSPYLDVSVQAVPLIKLWIHFMMYGRYSIRIAPFGNLWFSACLRLPTAYRSLPRPSSAPSAKAFALRPL